MKELVCLYEKRYSKKELSYKTWTTNSIIEYNTNTSIPHFIKSEDIVRTIDINKTIE